MNLKYELKLMCDRNRDGSPKARSDRHMMLQQMAGTLIDLGYYNMRAISLKPKHVEALMRTYVESELSIGTIKNRLAALRWWAEKINKQNVIAKDNVFYGIGSREFVSHQSKAKELDQDKLGLIGCPYVKMSLRLQETFGLRRKEAIKFIPVYADQGSYIQLKATWTKGGKARTVPIRTEEQREVLDQARSLAGKGSLIPAHLMYIQQQKIYEYETQKIGLSKLHGLRHRYAQLRYKELTGWDAPNCGGKTRKQLNSDERLQDKVARLTISQELGHRREQITAVYLGR